MRPLGVSLLMLVSSDARSRVLTGRQAIAPTQAPTYQFSDDFQTGQPDSAAYTAGGTSKPLAFLPKFPEELDLQDRLIL